MVLMIPMVLKNKDTKTIKTVRPKCQRPTALTAETTADTQPRNGLMVPMVLKKRQLRWSWTVRETRLRNLLFS